MRLRRHRPKFLRMPLPPIVSTIGTTLSSALVERWPFSILPPSTFDFAKRGAGRLPGAHTAGLSDAVHATMLRLQRRAERLTPMSLPFHAWARTGGSVPSLKVAR